MKMFTNSDGSPKLPHTYGTQASCDLNSPTILMNKGSLGGHHDTWQTLGQVTTEHILQSYFFIYLTTAYREWDHHILLKDEILHRSWWPTYNPFCMLCGLQEDMDRNHLPRSAALSGTTECERYWEAKTKMSTVINCATPHQLLWQKCKFTTLF